MKVKRAVIEFENGSTVEFTKPQTVTELAIWLDTYEARNRIAAGFEPARPMLRLYEVEQALLAAENRPGTPTGRSRGDAMLIEIARSVAAIADRFIPFEGIPDANH